jgi:hypothetical protein
VRALAAALRRVPRAAWWCAAIAVANALLWSVVTPPFQVPDEPSHAGYVQFLAEHGKPPTDSVNRGYSGEQGTVANLAWAGSEAKPPWTRAVDREVRKQLDSGKLSRSAAGESGPTTNYPPLYYAYEAVPYRLGYGLNFLDRLYLMRMFSALLAGLVALGTFFFVRELLPGTPWAWTVGTLAVAWQPLLGFVSGGVNNDALLYAVGAVLLALVARVLRRGLTTRRAVALGLVLAAGVLTKQSIVGLFPGVVLALALAVRATSPGQRRRAAVLAGSALAIGALAGLAYIAAGSLYDRSSQSLNAGIGAQGYAAITSWSGQVNYLWTSFLPRPPGLADTHGGVFVLWDVYLKGFVGIFGWFEFSFKPWVYDVAAVVFAVIGGLALREAWTRRDVLRRRRPELLSLATMVAGLLALLAYVGYRYRAASHIGFEQARYLLPLLPLWGALVALAARGAGRRWGPAVGALLVVLAIAHSLFSMLLVVQRYYT